MPVSLDVLNTTLYDLRSELLMTFEEKTPLLDWLKKRGRKSSEKGLYVQRDLMGGSPVQATALRNGSETFDTTLTEQIQKITVGTQRFGFAIAIPNLFLEHNDGKLGAIKLIKQYGPAALSAISIDLDRFFLTGVSNGKAIQTAECQGWNTLNGEKVFPGYVTGVTNGLIDFVAPSSQADVVQGLAKSQSYNYVNQYGHITGGWAASGRRTTSSVYRQCARFNTAGPNVGPDCMFADNDTYANIEAEDRTLVRTEYTQADIDKGIAGLHRRYLNADLYCAMNLVLSDFTGAAVDGLIYLLTSSGFEKVDFKELSMTPFEDRIGNQDNVVSKATGQFGIMCPNMAVQGAVTGGANP